MGDGEWEKANPSPSHPHPPSPIPHPPSPIPHPPSPRTPMNVIKTILPGVLVLEPKVFGDARGFFLESWNRQTFADLGLDTDFVQDNHSRSAKGVLRGLHYQLNQPQGKLVRVASGAVFDVAVDLRQSSPHFGKWFGCELSAENQRMLWIPPGFGHGFLVLSESADFLYKTTAYYAPQWDRGGALERPGHRHCLAAGGRTPAFRQGSGRAPAQGRRGLPVRGQPRILLTGCNGQVGWELARTLSTLGEVVATDSRTMDLADPDAIRRVMAEVRPRVIVNPAAHTAVDKAEGEPDRARAINALAPGVLAEEAEKLGALLVHYSTDYVFDGSGATPWREEDATGPLNVYGATKLEGENAIRERCRRHLIFRTSWVYGLRGANFLLTMRRLMRERPELKILRA
jgi:dTDP-4-dehydrorhamnose 3,5-epimerase